MASEAFSDEWFDSIASIYSDDFGGSIKDWPWYCYAVVVLQIHDQMDTIGRTWRAVLRQTSGTKEQARKARQLREALLKASVLVGFPKGINALTTLRRHILDSAPHLEQILDQDKSLRQSLSQSEKRARGHDFFSNIYAQHTQTVLDNMSIASGGDLSEFAITSIYGDLMAETSRLDEKSTSLLEFLACYASAGSSAVQAKSHMYGSHNVGNAKAEIRASTAICNRIEEALHVQIDRSDWEWLEKADGW